MKKLYITTSEHRIHYEPTPKVLAFFLKLGAMVDNDKISEQEMIGLAFSSENPILDHTLFVGRGAVTKEVLEDPAYAVLTDILFRKKVSLGLVDVAKLAAMHSMTVAEAAAELGVHESAIRQAISARRIGSWLKDGRHYLDPRVVKTLEIGRGPRAGSPKPDIEVAHADGSREIIQVKSHPLEIVMGHAKDASMRVKAQDQLIELGRIAGNVKHYRLMSWKRVVVMTTGEGGSKRAFVLERDARENELVFGPFSVRGRFVVKEKANSPKTADMFWKAYDVA